MEDCSLQKYGVIDASQSSQLPHTETPRVLIKDLDAKHVGQQVTMRMRIHNSRVQSAKMAFFTFRQQDETIQALIRTAAGIVSPQMMKWITGLPLESIVVVQALVQAAPSPIKSATCANYELKIEMCHLISQPTVQPAFSVEDANRSAAELAREDVEWPPVMLHTRLDNRVMDLRAPVNLSVFKIQAGVVKFFRDFLDARHFIEIHSPKLQGAATESGATVFEVKYFNTKAFLAQSPQLAKQMCIVADFERVYEIAPVFRAENSNTPRHLTEFTGVDLEMTFEEHYHEVLDMLEHLMLDLFKFLKDKYAQCIETVSTQHPAEEFLVPERPVRLTFAEGIKLLQDDGAEVGDLDDLSTENEKRLGAIVREKFKTDFFTLDQFPTNFRPFYTMPNAANPTYSNSYDMFMRGQEILSGAQRIHDPTMLEKRMTEVGIDPKQMQGYLDAFTLGAPLHAGAGFGLERIVMLFLQLKDIRRASLFPRDPSRLTP